MANASYKDFLDRGYREVLDVLLMGTTRTAQAKTYTYFNATVGMLTALTMTGNFNDFTSDRWSVTHERMEAIRSWVLL